MVTRRDYENARKNASKENTKVSDDEGYLNQRLNMDWGWLRSSSGASPFGLTWRHRVFQWTTYASRFALKGSKPGDALPS